MKRKFVVFCLIIFLFLLLSVWPRSSGTDNGRDVFTGFIQNSGREISAISQEEPLSAGSSSEDGRKEKTVLPMPSKWLHPDGIPRPRHEPLPPAPPLELKQVDLPRSLKMEPLPPGPKNRIALIVEDTLYASIEPNLLRHVEDLFISGYSVVVYRFLGGSAEELRENLIVLYEEPESLKGAQLIGELPYIIFEMYQNWGSGEEYEDFPCDLFYMNLNGTWSDTSGNGKYDTWSDDTDLDIWVSRLQASNLSALGSQGAILNHYYGKNHDYRTGILRPEAKALVYNDNDWSYMGPGDWHQVGQPYGTDNVVLVDEPDKTTASDYKNNHMPVNQELIATRSHGYSQGHGYYHGTNFGYVYNSDYRNILPPALFYQLYVCSAADYTRSNNLAGTIVFNHADSGLVAWGSTKTGGIWHEMVLYLELAEGQSIGKAFIEWFNSVNHLNFAPRFWYGMVLIGDASLRLSPFQDEKPSIIFADYWRLLE